MMKSVRKPALESERSFQPQQRQFASRPFAQKAEEHEAQPGFNEPRVSFSLADIDIFPRKTVQPKLRPGSVGDRYEQEADQMAGRVVQIISSPDPGTVQRQEGLIKAKEETSLNRTGMPDHLKSGLERLSGMDLSGVRVHYSSSKPAQLNALAYAQGHEIHLAPGQERHLPHEGWHVVQQAQGRVKPTMQAKAVSINASPSLECEADLMGERAATQKSSNRFPAIQTKSVTNESGLKSHLSPIGMPSNIIQRAFGFEYEIDTIDTYKKGLFGGHNILAKKDVLLRGAGFNLEADEMPGRSNMEFVTDAFPETPAGGAQLILALRSVDGILNILSNRQGMEVSAANLIAFGAPIANRYLCPMANSFPFIGKPQVTAGIRLDAMDRFFSDISGRAIVAGDTAAGNNAARVLGGQLTPNAGSREATSTMAGMTDVGQARNQAIASITYWDGIIQLYDPTNPHITGVPALTALVTQLTMYLVRGAQGLPGYGKLIAGGLMGRTDFAKVFNLLANTDWPVYNYFRNFPNVFVNVVMRAASNAYGHQLNDAGPVFEGRLYNDPGMYANDPNFQANLLPQLKRDDWLRGIVNNIDKMTAISYPVSGSKKQKKNQRAEIESLGGYGAGVDQVPTNIVGNLEDAPIVELRGLKPIYSGMLTPMMLDLYRYIHIVNTAGLQNFPGEMLDMPQGDKFDLITNQGNSVAIRYQTVQNALADINHW